MPHPFWHQLLVLSLYELRSAGRRVTARALRDALAVLGVVKSVATVRRGLRATGFDYRWG